MAGFKARLVREQLGQAAISLVGAAFLVTVVTGVMATVGKAFLFQDRQQHVVDLAALAGAKQMKKDRWRLFVSPRLPDGAANPAHLTSDQYKNLAGRAARIQARLNSSAGQRIRVAFTAGPYPVKLTVTARSVHKAQVPLEDRSRPMAVRVSATAQLSIISTGLGAVAPTQAGGGGYSGPLAYRQGKPIRPDVAAAFDQLARAARSSGVELLVNSGFRSDAEQTRLFAAHPDPKWVARPGTSLHRYGTELDLGPASAYGWLANNARRFGFIKRYAWEPWHFGFGTNPRDQPAQYEIGSHESGRSGGGLGAGMPEFVPERFAAPIARAASRWNVPAELLAAQIYQESKFDPFARSHAGAQGIAQFMPGTARAYGLADPYNAAAAINAQAHLTSDLLKQFSNTALALAAYNAGPGAVSRCSCVPANGETPNYVANILGMLLGANVPSLGVVGADYIGEPKLVD